MLVGFEISVIFLYPSGAGSGTKHIISAEVTSIRWIIESCGLFESATSNLKNASQLLVSWLIRCMGL